jgi:hypothetical protein
MGTTLPFAITTIKTTEAGDGWILRGCNLGFQPITLGLTPWRPFTQAWQANMNEELQKPLAVGSGGELCLTVGGHEIFTILLKDSTDAQ